MCTRSTSVQFVLQVENLMTAVERGMEYSKLNSEDLPTKPDNKVGFGIK